MGGELEPRNRVLLFLWLPSAVLIGPSKIAA